MLVYIVIKYFGLVYIPGDIIIETKGGTEIYCTDDDTLITDASSRPIFQIYNMQVSKFMHTYT